MCLFVFACVVVCVLSSRCLVCRPSHLCVCAVSAHLRRVNTNINPHTHTQMGRPTYEAPTREYTHNDTHKHKQTHNGRPTYEAPTREYTHLCVCAVSAHLRRVKTNIISPPLLSSTFRASGLLGCACCRPKRFMLTTLAVTLFAGASALQTPARPLGRRAAIGTAAAASFLPVAVAFAADTEASLIAEIKEIRAKLDGAAPLPLPLCPASIPAPAPALRLLLRRPAACRLLGADPGRATC